MVINLNVVVETKILIILLAMQNVALEISRGTNEQIKPQAFERYF